MAGENDLDRQASKTRHVHLPGQRTRPDPRHRSRAGARRRYRRPDQVRGRPGQGAGQAPRHRPGRPGHPPGGGPRRRPAIRQGDRAPGGRRADRAYSLRAAAIHPQGTTVGSPGEFQRPPGTVAAGAGSRAHAHPQPLRRCRLCRGTALQPAGYPPGTYRALPGPRQAQAPVGSRSHRGTDRQHLQHRAAHRCRGGRAGQRRTGHHQHPQRDRGTIWAVQLLRSRTHGGHPAGDRPAAVPPASSRRDLQLQPRSQPLPQ